MGLKDRAKKMAEQAQAMAEQAQAKLDEQQTKFNQGQQGSSAPPPGPQVTYDQHGRPMPVEGAAPPAVSPTAAEDVREAVTEASAGPPPEPSAPPKPPSPPSTPLEPVARDEYAPPKLSGGDPLAR